MLALGALGDGAVVEVRRSAGGVTAASGHARKTTEAADDIKAAMNLLEQQFHHITGLLDGLGDSVAPWKASSRAKKCSKAKEELVQQASSLLEKLEGAHNQTSRQREEVSTMMATLAKQEQALMNAVAAKEAAEAAAQRSAHTAAQQAATKDQQIAALEKRAQAAEEQVEELQASVARLSKGRESVSIRLKEVTSEYQSTADVAEREIRRLQSELKKAEDTHAAAVANAVKESAAALADKAKEHKVLQRRYDSMREMADSNKEAAAQARKAAEEAAATQARALKAAEERARLLADARAAHEALQTELDALQAEHAGLHAAYMAAGGVESQVCAAWAAYGRAAKPEPGSSAAAAKGKGAEASKPGGNRIALRPRGGFCLHAKPCGAAADVNKVEPLPYTDARGLEALLRGGGFFMCPTCSIDPGFFA